MRQENAPSAPCVRTGEERMGHTTLFSRENEQYYEIAVALHNVGISEVTKSECIGSGIIIWKRTTFIYEDSVHYHCVIKTLGLTSK